MKLSSLLEVTKAINSNFSREQLLKIYESILKNQLKFPRFVVYSAGSDNRYMREISSGISDAALKQVNIEEYLQKIADPQEIYYLPENSGNFFDAVIPIFHKDQALAFVLVGIDSGQHEMLLQDIPFIQALTNIIYVAFENKNLARENLRQESIRKELELASQMQNMLLPGKFPETNDLEVDAFYKSHTEVGGDYYDFFRLNDDEYAICMADVSGKGVSAALLMSNFQANIRALFYYVPSLEELATILNKKVMDSAKGEKFITAFFARYNIRTRMLSYVNAGHLPPIIVADNKVDTLREGSIGLGMLDELPFIKTNQMEVPPHTLMVCYTDGLTELENNEERFFGIEALKEMIRDNKNLSTSDLTIHVLRHLESFKQDQPYKDDIAFLACRFH